jgi:hypothetical protein
MPVVDTAAASMAVVGTPEALFMQAVVDTAVGASTVAGAVTAEVVDTAEADMAEGVATAVADTVVEDKGHTLHS